MRSFAVAAVLCALFGPRQELCAQEGIGGDGEVKQPPQVHLANGFKVGDATSSTAMVWVRLTEQAEANTAGTAFEKLPEKVAQLPEGKQLGEMEGAVMGAAGEVRVRYRGRDEQAKAQLTAWVAVDATTDFAHTFLLRELQPACTYDVVVEGRSGSDAQPCCSAAGHFRTAPLREAAVAASFCVIACQDYPRRDDAKLGHRIYREMLQLDPDFLVHTGDTLYYDKPQPFANTVALARFKWNRFYGLALPREFHQQVATWFIKDDHDTLKDDCWPGQKYGELTFARGVQIYREQLPVASLPYRQVRWGKHLAIWCLEGREYRSANREPDGPDKTILGATQKQWLKQTLAASDASFRIVISATPIVGPDRSNKRDNHANANFQTEGDELRAFLAQQANTLVICGDRHWQYASHDPVTGLREWCCGSASDQHAGGFRIEDRSDMHDYLKICGGFLQVLVTCDEDEPRLLLRHYDPRGAITHEDLLEHQ